MKSITRSLFVRTALTLALAFVVFQAAAFWVVTRTLIIPVAERSADDLAGLVVLSAQTWVELPPETRAAFERELARRHGLRLTTVDVGATADAPHAGLGSRSLWRRPACRSVPAARTSPRTRRWSR